MSAFLSGDLGPRSSPSNSHPHTHSAASSEVGGHLVSWSALYVNMPEDKTLQQSGSKVHPNDKHHKLLLGPSADMPSQAPSHWPPVSPLCPQKSSPSPCLASSGQHFEYLETWCWVSQGQTALAYFAAYDLMGFLDTADASDLCQTWCHLALPFSSHSARAEYLQDTAVLMPLERLDRYSNNYSSYYWAALLSL